MAPRVSRTLRAMVRSFARRRGVGFHAGGAGQVAQVGTLELVELQPACDGLEHAVGGAGQVSALETHVVVDRHPGQQRDFLTAQPRHAAGAAVVG
jgi:hypothetical protein